MNPRLSVNVATTWKWDLGQSVEACARRGIPAIGVTRVHLEPYGVERGLRQLRDSGLRVSSYAGITPYGLWTEARQQVLDEARRQMDLAAQMGAGCLYVVTGPRDRLPWDAAAARFLDALGELLPAAAEHGLRLAVEPVHPMRQDITFLNTARDSARILGEFDPARVGYVFDVYHLWWESDILETIAASAPQIAVVQVSDHKAKTLRTMDRAMLGAGIIPLAELLTALEGAGYRGDYDIEVISDDLEQMGYERALDRIIADFDRLWARVHA